MNKQSAPHRADQMRAFQAELKQLQAADVLRLPDMAQATQHRRIRCVHIGALVAMFGMALLCTSYPLQAQVAAPNKAVNSTGNAQAAARESGCVDKQTILDSISSIQTEQRFFGIPGSWLKRRSSHPTTQPGAEAAFAEVIFPALECKLKERAIALINTADASMGDDMNAAASARAWIEDVLAFERNYASFRRIIPRTKIDQDEALLRELDALVRYLYGVPLPKSVFAKKSHFQEALAKTDYREKGVRPTDMRQRISQGIARRARNIRQGVDRDIDRGAALLAALIQEQPPLFTKLQDFDAWMSQVQTRWLVSSAQANPCRAYESWLMQTLDALTKEYGYDSDLKKLAQQFEAAQCYEPSLRRLAQLHVAPYGALFLRVGERWAVAPAVAAEAEGIKRLLSLQLMKLAPKESFVCQQPLRDWNPQALAEAAALMREYQAFAHSIAPGEQSLTTRLARKQLHAVLDETMNHAQRRLVAADGSTGASVSDLSTSERLLDEQASNMARVSAPLLETLRMYQQLGFVASHAAIEQCARKHAVQGLQKTQALADASQLYAPKVEASSGLPRQIYALGSTPVTMDYLSRQLQRSQVLASRAEPFVALLKNTDVGYSATGGGVDWDATRQELNRYVNLKGSSGQVEQLHALFLKQLSVLATDNCDKTLDAYVPGHYGKDLFSHRRVRLVQQSQLYCAKLGDK